MPRIRPPYPLKLRQRMMQPTARWLGRTTSQGMLVLLGLVVASPVAGQQDPIALIRAAEDGHASVVRLLLAGGLSANGTDQHGRTALMLAAGDGHSDVVSLLAAYGADLNAQDRQHRTALVRASGDGHVGAVRLLLAHGAELNAADQQGRTALMHATPPRSSF